ncbi:MAG: cation:proton antiporter [Rhodospirillales bacterium]|nr:MAG: cation:proton antiporter [Rhodospirillales bacterium]
MESSAADLTQIALVTTAAVLAGLALTRLRQPAIVGYILAGVLLGPSGAGLIESSDSIQTLAELGVLMLLFVIGMELSLRSFVTVLRTSILCTLIQIATALAIAFAVAELAGWSHPQAVLMGFILAMSSTAVTVKLLDQIGELRSDVGRVALGVTIAQDLAVVPMLMVLAALGGTRGLDPWLGLEIVVAVGLLAALIAYFTRRKRVILPTARWFRGRKDMAALAAVAFCFSAAAASGMVGLSPAYGAFLAGLVVGNSTDHAAAVRATVPIENVLMVVFFLSIGLLLDLGLIWQNIGLVIGLLLAVVLLKTVVNVGALRLLGEPWERAFPAGLAMGQIGEFSFVLAAVGLGAGLIDDEGYRLTIAVVVLSLLTSPLWLVSARRFHVVAAEGVVNIRVALAEVYRTELTALERLAAVTRMVASALARAGRRLMRLFIRRR